MNDYSVHNRIIGKVTKSSVAHMRVQVPVEVRRGWTQIMVFSEPQNAEVFSAEAITEWNCRKTILYVRDRGYNAHIRQQKSYNLRFLFDGLTANDLLGKFKLYFFEGHPDNLDCYADDYNENYCGGFTTTKPVFTTRSPPTTQRTTTRSPTTRPTTRRTTTRTTTTTTTTSTTPACKTPDEICAESGDGFYKVCDCYHWTQCYQGGQYNTGKNKCGPGLIWNSVIRMCDWETNVRNHCPECDCKPTQPPTTTTQPWTGPVTTRAPTPNSKCPPHKAYLVQEGNILRGKVSGKTFNLDTCERASDPFNKPRSPIEEWFTKEMWDQFFYKSNLGFGPHACLPYSYEAFIIAARYFPDFGNEYHSHTPDGKPMPQGFTAEETKRRDVAAFLAHMVQETGENNGWILSGYKGHGLTWDEAQECYMKGALWTWFEGGGDGTGQGVFPCGDHPSCGDFSPKQEYCEPTKITYGMGCSQETDSRGYKISYAGRGPIQTSWNYNYGMFAR